MDYAQLAIYNGTVCQAKAIQRYLALIGNEEWEQISYEMRKYCENDVRAMIALEWFVITVLHSVLNQKSKVISLD